MPRFYLLYRVLLNEIRKHIYPALCSCHFQSGNENPLPHGMQSLKRKQSPDEALSEPTIKYCRSSNVNDNESYSEEYLDEDFGLYEGFNETIEENTENFEVFEVYANLENCECAVNTEYLDNYEILPIFEISKEQKLKEEIEGNAKLKEM